MVDSHIYTQASRLWSVPQGALCRLCSYAVIFMLGAGPTDAWSKPNVKGSAQSKTAKVRPTRAQKKVTKKKTRTYRSKRRRVKTRCRDIFCTTQVMRMDRASTEQKGLTGDQVESTIKKNHRRLEPCLVKVRRRDPSRKVARMEFVVTGKGKVLATRVDGRRYSPLSRCLLRQMRRFSFPTFKQRRAVASVTLAIPQ